MNIQDIILLIVLIACTVIAILSIFKEKSGCCSGNCNTCCHCSKYKFSKTSGEDAHKK